ncbi:hypothetical protein DICPUDRAFT_45417 [Dictyostelium purpureum]|uniref:Uncharacterized protein n=1 Tax=Dictyostelium purpureum TaxID=5786 RepID=F0ZAD4_DICPU|nr:uncharacterized protein DICPUDRAFT_45417 [Dictyostelium purpureum]EGC39105.1 hypothetical protein DICPUDRAFT_45417 [Dictyostelium purpureum]|eukprot:XP_003284357.1 hypothetical protein DICPUDRAFT_45417 [Dictyostelium purpureum]
MLEETFEPSFGQEYQGLVSLLRDGQLFKVITKFPEISELEYDYHNDKKLYPLFKKYTEYMRRFGFNIKQFIIEPRKLSSQISSYTNLFKKRTLEDGSIFMFGNTSVKKSFKPLKLIQTISKSTVSSSSNGSNNSSGNSESEDEENGGDGSDTNSLSVAGISLGSNESSMISKYYRHSTGDILESIQFIGYFRLHRSIVFNILFEEYALEEKNLNSIIVSLKKFFQQLVPKSDIDSIKISMNPLFEKIINDSSIDFKREVILIYNYLYSKNISLNHSSTNLNYLNSSLNSSQVPSPPQLDQQDEDQEEFDKVYQEIIKIFDNSKRYFVFCRDIDHFTNYVSRESNYLVISNMEDFNKQVEMLKNEKFVTSKVSQDIENKISSLVGGLNSIYHLQLFQGINKQLLDWFSKFNDIQNFVSQCQMINDRISMELDRSENSNLINNADYAFKSIHRFVQYYRVYKRSLKNEQESSVPTVSKTIFSTVSQFFETSFTNEAPSSYSILQTVSKNIEKIKVIFESYTLDDSKNIVKIVQLIIKEKSKFISYTTNGQPGWFIQAHGSTVTYGQDLIDDLYRGLELGSLTDKEGYFEQFRKLYLNIRKIHKIHLQLDSIYHPGYPNGEIEVIIDCSLEDTNPLSLCKKIVDLKADCKDWRDKMKDLPSQLLLLKKKGISSFYSKVDKYLNTIFITQNQETMSKDNAYIFSSLIYPFVKYCFPLIEIDEALIFTTINKNILLKSTKDTFEFLKIFFNFLEPELKLKFNFELNPSSDKRSSQILSSSSCSTIQAPTSTSIINSSSSNLIILKCDSFENLYNSLFLANNNKAPHPSQLLYTSPNESFDFNYFNEIQALNLNLNYFLIGIPQNKDELFIWISKKYFSSIGSSSPNSIQQSKIYIVTTENRELVEFFNNIKQIEVKGADWSCFKNYWSLVHTTVGINSLSILIGNGKTYYIQSEISEKSNKENSVFIQVHIRPKWNCSNLIDQLTGLLKNNIGIQRVSLYIYISSFYDFNSFNIFIYPLITYGFIVAENGDIFNLSGRFLLDIYVEVGSMLDETGLPNDLQSNNQISYEKYVKKSIPFLYNIGKVQDSTKPWKISDLEKKCFRYLYYLKDFNFDYEGTIEFYQKPQLVNTSAMDKEGYGLVEFINDLKTLLVKQFPQQWESKILPYTHFLSNNNFLHERKIFFTLLSEKLNYMDVYIDSSIGHCGNIGNLLPWILLECLMLSCPNFSIVSSKNIWSNPPTISKTHLNMIQKVRILKDRVEATNVHPLEFIDFDNNMENYSKVVDKYSALNLIEEEWKPHIFNLKKSVEKRDEFFKLVAKFFKIYDNNNSMIISKICSDSGYILTPEFALRLIILHDRLRSGKSVVLNGDTGVGKTKMLHFYSLILNFQYVEETQKDFNAKLVDEINKIIDKRESVTPKIKSIAHLHRIPEVIDDLFKEKPIAAKDLLNGLVEFILKLLDKNHLVHKNHPQLEYYRQKYMYRAVSLDDAKMFSKLACNQLNYIKVYHRFIMHLKFTSIQFKQALDGIFVDANHLLTMKSDIKILVFIDEFNTSPTDTLSLINEIFMDKSCDGVPIPSNVYFIGAMNPLTKLNNNIIQNESNSISLSASSSSIPTVSSTSNDSELLFNKELNPLLDFTGVDDNDPQRDHVFMVQPTPPSMNKIIFNFGQFKEENEIPFLECLFEIKHNDLDKEYSRHLKTIIIECQSFLRNPFIINSKIHPSIRDIMRVSKLYEFFTTHSIGVQMLISTSFFSDEERSIFFLEKNKQQTLNLSLSSSSSGINVPQYVVPTHLLNKDYLHWLSIIATVFVAYYLRIPVVYRKKFKEVLNNCFNKLLPPNLLSYKSNNQNKNKAIGFSKVCKEVLRAFSEKIKSKIPKGVALTQSLQLNIFTMIISINSSIPLLIIGPPGNSKTLAVSLVIDIMNDNNIGNSSQQTQPQTQSLSSSQVLHSSLSTTIGGKITNIKNKQFDYNNGFVDMSSIYTLKYQCTPHTSDEEIKAKYTQAIGHQDFFQMTKHVVFLDEAGLINEYQNHSPLKILHGYLDKEQHMSTDQNISNIETIILSNKILDAAKNNRMLILFHSDTIHEKDEEILVYTCLPMIQKISDKKEQLKITQALCKGYRLSNHFTKDTKPNLFHQRDFVFFLRHLNRTLEVLDTTIITPEILMESLERNFNGIPFNKFKELSSLFLREFGFDTKSKSIASLLNTENTIIRIKESLSEKLDLTNNPNNSAFRFIMVIDPSNNESSLRILREISSNPKVIRVGGFKDDQTISSLVDLFSEIKKEMSCGGTVIMVNTSIIDQCFYDVFNRYFITLSSADNETSLWATISFGTHTAHQKVHPNFKIIVLQPLSNIKNVQLPWLNRFEKYFVTTETYIRYFLENNCTQFDKDIYHNLLNSSNQLISHFNQNEKHYLYGYQEKETITSIIYSYIKFNLNSKSNDGKNNEKKYYSSYISDINDSLSPIGQINLKLLQLGKPDTIFHSNFLPSNYIKEYLLGQEHFSIFRFLQQLQQPHCTNKSSIYTIYTRSSIDLFNINEELLNLEYYKNQNIPNFNSNIRFKKLFKVFQYNSFKSSFSFKKKFNEFLNNEFLGNNENEIQTAIFVADMNEITNSQINFITNHLDKSVVESHKKNVVIICHYPHELWISNQVKFGVNYLHQMDYLYVDSLGVKFDSKDPLSIGSNESSSSISNSSFLGPSKDYNDSIDSDVRSWIAKGCGLDINLNIESIYSILEKSLLHQINDIIKQINIKFDSEYEEEYNLTTDNNNPNEDDETSFDVFEIKEDIYEIFSKHPVWCKEIIKLFMTKSEPALSSNKNYNVFHTIVSDCSQMILSGYSMGKSLSDSIKETLNRYLQPIVFKVLHSILSQQNISQLKSIEVDSDQENLILLFIKSIRFNEKPISLDIIEKSRFEQIIINYHYKESNIPLYDSISDFIQNQIEQIINQQSKKVNNNNHHEIKPKELMKRLEESIQSIPPFNELVKFIEENEEIRDSFVEDFVIRSLKILKPSKWMKLFRDIIDLLTKQINGHSFLKYFVLLHYQQPLIAFLNDITDCLYSIFEKDNKKNRDQLQKELLASIKSNPYNETLIQMEIIKLIVKRFDSRFLEFYNDKKKPIDEFISSLGDWTMELSIIFNIISMNDIFKNLKLLEQPSESTNTNNTIENNEDQEISFLSKAINIHYNYQIALSIFINQESTNKNDFLTQYNLSFTEIFDKCKSKKHLMLNILKPIIPLKIQNITEFLMIYNSQLYHHLLPDDWIKQVICDVFEKTTTNEIEDIFMKIKDTIEPMTFIPEIYLNHFDWFNIRIVTQYRFVAPNNYPLIQALYRSLLEVSRNSQNGNNTITQEKVNINDLIKYQLKEETPFSKMKSIVISRNLMDRLIDHLYICYSGINNNEINEKLLKNNISTFKDSLYLTFILNPDNENNYIQNLFNQLYLLNELKYISEKHLDILLNNQDLLDLLGLSNISKLHQTDNETYLLLINIIKSFVDDRETTDKNNNFIYRYQEPKTGSNAKWLQPNNFIDSELFNQEFKLMKFFEENLKTLSLSTYFPKIIKFLTLFRKFFFKRLPRDYIHKTIGEAFEYLLESFESKESISPLLNSWNQCKESFNEYLLLINSNNTSQLLQDELPISSIVCHYSFIGGFSSSNNNNKLIKDILSNQIEEWKNIVRDLLLTKDNYLNENESYIRIQFKQIFGLQLKNQFRNYIGSNFLEYFRFLNDIKSYYKKDQQQLNQDSIIIQNKIIANFISQKKLLPDIKSNLLNEEFPFSWKKTTSNNSLSQQSIINNDNIYPDTIKTLKQLLNNGLEYDLSTQFHDEEFKEICKTIPFNQLTSISEYLVESILLFTNLDNHNNGIAILSKKISEFNPLNPVIHSLLPEEFIKLIEITPISSIFQIAKHVINNCSIFDRLYTGIIHEPKTLDEIHVDNINQIEIKIISSIETNPKYLYQWVETLSGIITSMSLSQVKQLVSNQKIKFKDLADSFINSSLIYDFSINLPICYYPLFMRSLVKTLTHLHLKSNYTNNHISKEQYQEPNWEFKQRPMETINKASPKENFIINRNTKNLSILSSSNIIKKESPQNQPNIIKNDNITIPSIITTLVNTSIQKEDTTSSMQSPLTPILKNEKIQSPRSIPQTSIASFNNNKQDSDSTTPTPTTTTTTETSYNLFNLYDRELFIKFLNEKTKFADDFKKNLTDLGIDCFSVVLNLKKEDWLSVKIPLAKRNELINLTKLEVPQNIKKEYQFPEPLDLQCSHTFNTFLDCIIGEDKNKVVEELGFESLISMIITDESGWDELTSELLIILKPITTFHLMNQLKEIKLK